MCDNDSIGDMNEHARRSAELTRRHFSALSLAGGLSLMLPPVGNAAEVTAIDVEIKTPDGVADAYFVHPSSGAHPGVLMWTDVFGLRPAYNGQATGRIWVFGAGAQSLLPLEQSAGRAGRGKLCG
jgi:carboxymethylenebutenolidase